MAITLTVVIPIFNEEKNIPVLYKRLKKVINKISKSHEIIFVDDGSSDTSLEVIKKLRIKDKKIKAISFSRNFGHMPAVIAGLKESIGQKVVIMDADLQDPPEVITRMWKKSEEGFDVIYGVKKKRKEGILRKLLFKIFYRILNSISTYKMPLDAGTFSLIDKKVVLILGSLQEKNKYLSGLRSWSGFRQTGITYERGKRFMGKEASLRRLSKLALDGMISFSYLPLRLATFLGFVCSLLSIIGIITVMILRIFFGIGLIGWASTITTILLLSSVQLITLGIIGEYLARIYDEVKSRPEYIISKTFGIKS